MLRIVDFGGHPFTVALAAELGRQGDPLEYVHLASNDTSPHGDIPRLCDAGVQVRAVDLGRPFEKHRPLARLRDEIDFGLRLAPGSGRARTIVACQLPVVSGTIALVLARVRRQRFVLWLQDFQADIAAATGSRRTARLLGVLERALIRRAHHVIAISDVFAERVRAAGRRGSVSVLPNWAPLADLPVRERDNDWARRHGLGEGPRVVYSGTLGAKHRAGDVERLARHAREVHGADVVIVAAGAGADRLAASDAMRAAGARVLPLQPIDQVADVLGSADILLVTLDDAAGEASVPSKVLAYLCAGRPVLGLLPRRNPSAQLLEETGAGVVTTTVSEATRALDCLLADPELRQDMGQRGRAHAEASFDIGRVTDAFRAAIG